MSKFSIIVGCRGLDRAIGIKGKLPWNIPKDMAFFRKITTTKKEPNLINVVIMGKNTYKSMNCHPLKGRINFVCTSMDVIDMPEINLYFVRTLEDALKKCQTMANIGKVFVIGGEKLYSYAIEHPLCEEIIINEFYPCSPNQYDININTIPSDTYFPVINTDIYELILDYNSINSVGEIFMDGVVYDEPQYIMIRYKRYSRKQ